MSKELTNALAAIKKLEGGPGTAGPSIQFTRLHEKALLPAYNPGSPTLSIHVCDITESGRDNRITLPSHSLSRPIPTGLSLGGRDQTRSAILLTPPRLLGAGLLVVNGTALGGPDYGDTGEIRVLLFNTRYEAARVMHGEHIADLLFVASDLRPVRWADFDRTGGGNDAEE